MVLLWMSAVQWQLAAMVLSQERRMSALDSLERRRYLQALMTWVERFPTALDPDAAVRAAPLLL